MPNLGDKGVFIEHYAIVKDLDSLMEEPYTMLLLEGIQDVESRVEDSAVKNCVLAMNGNALEAEYQGKTGRTVQCTWSEITKFGWKRGEEITPAEVDLKDLFKL